jgi:hypothetical protein
MVGDAKGYAQCSSRLAEGVLCVLAMNAIVCLPLSGLSADEDRDMAVHQDIRGDAAEKEPSKCATAM